MNRKRIAVVWTFVAALVLLVPTAAHAEDMFSQRCQSAGFICVNGAQVSQSPVSVADFCRDATLATEPDVYICVRKSDDVVWVKDTEADGHSAVGEVTTNDEVTRVCRNRYGSGTWVKCDWNWVENSGNALSAEEFDADTDTWSHSSLYQFFGD
jgi:hypothetical protein